MTSQIAESIMEAIAPQGVAVVISGQHMCSMMRGVKKSTTRLVSSCWRGVFENNEALQQRFFSQIRLP